MACTLNTGITKLCKTSSDGFLATKRLGISAVIGHTIHNACWDVCVTHRCHRRPDSAPSTLSDLCLRHKHTHTHTGLTAILHVHMGVNNCSLVMGVAKGTPEGPKKHRIPSIQEQGNRWQQTLPPTPPGESRWTIRWRSVSTFATYDVIYKTGRK